MQHTWLAFLFMHVSFYPRQRQKGILFGFYRPSVCLSGVVTRERFECFKQKMFKMFATIEKYRPESIALIHL